MSCPSSGAILSSQAPPLGVHLAVDLHGDGLASGEAPVMVVPLTSRIEDSIEVADWVQDSEGSPGGSGDDFLETHISNRDVAIENRRLKDELAALKQRMKSGMDLAKKGRSSRSRSQHRPTHRGRRGGAQRYPSVHRADPLGNSSGCPLFAPRFAQEPLVPSNISVIPAVVEGTVDPVERKSYATVALGPQAQNIHKQSALIHLEYIPPIIEDGNVTVLPPKGTTDGGHEEWESTLNCYERRRKLWRDLAGKANLGIPWVVLGDFNAIKSQDESCGGSLLWPDWKNELAACLFDAELDDLKFTSHFLTWSNKREEEPIMRKLDRVLVNKAWEDHFNLSEAIFLPPGLSDHSAMLIRLASLTKKRSSFRFFDFWADHHRFLELVWEVDTVGTPMFRLWSKLMKMKPVLRKLNRKYYSDLSNRVLYAKDRLDIAQGQLLEFPLGPL
ncbi:hypothetical protein CJ030_MR3G005569 [Morella rubra]|uniref:Endonuclease/exonuclease/phosphatase domain-containing protein n=1 Tax=Morella rubra TaxID=262757 RepID=A0A6A1W4D1_9ROSI|nr:hypothetical protein CJ030_MR3G005569 [Morella rubra]